MTAAETAKLLIDAQIKLEEFMRTDPRSPSAMLTILMLIKRLAAYEDPINEQLSKCGGIEAGHARQAVVAKRLAEDC